MESGATNWCQSPVLGSDAMEKRGTIAIAHLFRLRNPSQGFVEENREYLREVTILTVLDGERDAYEQSLNIIEPMIPLSFYSSDLSYADMRCAFKATRRLFFDALDNFLPFMAFDLFDMRPEKTIAYIRRIHRIRRIRQLENAASPSADSELLELAGLDDEYNRKYNVIREYGYLNSCGSETLEARERENPFVYGQYRLENVPGCEHYWRTCSCICPTCAANDSSTCVYTCHICHNLNSSHVLMAKDIREIICWHCGNRGPINQRCTHCNALLSTRFCSVCQILSLLPPDYETFVHCDHCNRCVSIHEQETHYCARDNEAEDCPICLMPLNMDLPTLRLPCPAGHCVHAICSEKANEVSGNGEKCPLDGTIVGERDKYYLRTAVVHSHFRENVSKWKNFRSFSVCSCIDCNKLAFNLCLGDDSVPFCHSCFGCNTVELVCIDLTVEQVESLSVNIPKWLSRTCEAANSVQRSDFSLCDRANYNSYTREQIVERFFMEIEWLVRNHPILFTFTEE